jgi:hypothetical protein
MRRKAGRAVLGVVAGFATMFVTAWAAFHLPVEEATRVALAEGAFAPVLVVGRTLTVVFDALGPQGYPGPASHFAPKWATDCLVVLTLLLVAVGFAVLALGAQRLGWRGTTALPLALAGVVVASDDLDVWSVWYSGASPVTWLGAIIVLAAVFLILDNVARSARAGRVAQMADRVALGLLVVGLSWLGYLIIR